MRLSRREFGRAALAVASMPVLAKADSASGGVKLGIQSFSYRDRGLGQAIGAMKQLSVGYAELWSGHVEPLQKTPRVKLRDYRLTVSLDKYKKVREQFNAAGIELYAFSLNMKDDCTDAELARAFAMTKALGLTRMTSSSNVTTVERIYPLAKKNNIAVGMHNHSRIEENEFARPEDFENAMRGKTPFIGICLDIGHYWAAGFDPVSFLEKHHDVIVTVHLKDRQKNQGPNMPFGEGGTPIKEVLQLMKEKQYPMPALIEYEYKGQDTALEVRKCLDYCKNALA